MPYALGSGGGEGVNFADQRGARRVTGWGGGGGMNFVDQRIGPKMRMDWGFFSTTERICGV